MWWQGKGDLTSLGISLKIQKGREQDFSKNFYFKPGDRKRLLTVLIVCLIFCNSFLMPVQRAEAVVPVVFAAPEVALAAFVGVVGIGAIGMDLFGQSKKADEMYAYAAGAWTTGNQAISSAYNSAISSAADWFSVAGPTVDGYLDKITVFLFGESALNVAIDQTYNMGFGDNYTRGTRYFSASPRNGYLFLTTWGLADSMAYHVPTNGTSPYFYATLANKELGTRKMASTFTRAEMNNALGRVILFGATGTTVVPRDYIVPEADYKRARDAFPASIPAPSGRDFVYTPTANPGVDLYMREDGKIADDAGKVYAPDAVTVKSGPVPQTVTDAKTGEILKDAVGNPVIAVPVGGIKTGDVATTVPGTLVNVKTGEVVGTKTGDTVANPPLDWASQPTTAINWGPLKTAAGAFTKKFPFSIPWDVGRQLAIFDVQPKAPVWRMDKTVDMPDFGTGLKNDIHFKWDFDLAVLDPYAVPLRWFVIIAADVGLMLGLRRFLPE